MMGWPEGLAFFSVLGIDIALAGDNALVVGMAASGLPGKQRRKAIMVGLIGAAVLRIAFAVFTAQLLKIVGLTLAGGLLLLWVAWKLWRDIRARHHQPAPSAPAPGTDPGKSLRQAVTRIILADISMSLDNVLAVAGAARGHFWVLVTGLGLSVALTGLAAEMVARITHRHPWISYGGLLIVVGVAVSMIHSGAQMVAEHMPMPY